MPGNSEGDDDIIPVQSGLTHHYAGSAYGSKLATYFPRSRSSTRAGPAQAQGSQGISIFWPYQTEPG